MRKKELDAIIETIALEEEMSMTSVELVVSRFVEMTGDLSSLAEARGETISSGIMPLDIEIALHPGMTIISGPDSSGKSAAAKKIAQHLYSHHGMSVLYVDTEHKKTPLDNDILEGIYYTNTTEAKAIHQLLQKNLIDVLIIDTVTAMTPQARKHILHHSRIRAAYTIVVTQQWYDAENNRKVPAVGEEILSQAKTHLKMGDQDPDQMMVDNIDMARCTIQVAKYSHDRTREGLTGTVVVRDGIINNTLTAFDYLKYNGNVSSVGSVKEVDSKPVGKLAVAMEEPGMREYLIERALIRMKTDHEVSINEYADPLYRVPVSPRENWATCIPEGTI